MRKHVAETATFSIREAQDGDITDIASVASVLGYSPISLGAMQATLTSIQTSSNDKVWVAILQPQPKESTNPIVIGWLHAFYAHRLASVSFIEIGGLAVDAEQQGRGVGRALVQQANLWAEQLGCSLRVRCNETRVDTHQFYRALGFKANKTQNVFSLNL